MMNLLMLAHFMARLKSYKQFSPSGNIIDYAGPKRMESVMLICYYRSY